MMFGDLENFMDDDETLDLLRRYKDMLLRKNNEFFDICEFECIIDYFSEQYNFSDALKVVNLAIRQHPNESSIKLRYAQLLIETLKPAKALRVIQSISMAEADNCELFLARGIALNMTAKYADAQIAFKRAIELSDSFKDEVAYNVAQSYMQYGLYEVATKYLLLAYRFNESNILVLYDLGLCYEKLKKPERSLIYYNKYLELDPFAEHVWNNMGLLHTSMKDFRSAGEAFDYALAINPQFIPAFFNKADMFADDHRFDKAIEVYHELLAEDPVNIKASCNLGKCYIQSERFSEALDIFRSILEISSDCADAWFGVGMVYLRQHKFSMCISSLKRAVDFDPENSDFWFMLGEVYSKMRKLNKAIDAYHKAADLDPDDCKAAIAYAQILFKKKRISEAIHMLKALYEQESENSMLNYRLAAYYVYEHDLTNATKYFIRGLHLNYQEHSDMFRHFPRTKSLPAFRNIMDNLEFPVDQDKFTLK